MFSRIILPASAVAGCFALVGLSAIAWTGDPPPAQKAETKAAQSSPRPQLDRNLGGILLAMHNYVSANDRLPSPATHSNQGRPLLSWRVALLPYLDQKELFDRFHLDEPWDSPHNKELIALMPAVFESPGYPTPSGKTRFRGVEAPGAMFGPPRSGQRSQAGGVMGAAMGSPSSTGSLEAPSQIRPAGTAPPQDAKPLDQGLRFTDITDGTSNTVLILVAEDPIEWTRPGELEVPGELKPGAPLPAIVEDDAGYILAMVDGSVQRLPKQPGRREILLPALLTYAGGEVLSPISPSPSVFAPVPSKPPAEPAAEAKAPAAFERRLRRVEEKLDEILDRLDGLAAPKR